MWTVMLIAWIKRRFRTFDYLPEYFHAVRLHFLDVTWGIGVGAAVPYMIFGLYSLFKTPPPLANWLAIIGALFLAGYYLWRADHVRLIPQLEVTKVIAQNWIDRPTGKPAIGYCFEVLNKSETLTIEWINPQLEKMNPEVENLNWLPVPLHQKHDNPPAGIANKRDFNLNPGELKQIDLVSALQGGDNFTVNHIAGAGVNQFVPLAGEHRLGVKITAKDTPAEFAWFTVWMSSEGVLQCTMEPKHKNSTP